MCMCYALLTYELKLKILIKKYITKVLIWNNYDLCEYVSLIITLPL